MIKYVFSIIACIFLCLPIHAQLLLSENFNNGFPVGWQSIDVDGLTPVPQVAYCGNAFAIYIDFDSTTSNDSIVVATSWFTPVGIANNYLITPQITLLSNGNFLRWQAKSQDPSYPDGYMILVSTTTNNIAAITDTIYNTNAEVPYWINREKNLDAYAGQPIYIAFRHYANNKFILALDNIEVFADITFSVDENYLDKSISIYPNPSTGIINIQLNDDVQSTMRVAQCKVFDITGKELINTPIQSRGAEVNLSHLQNGVYFLQIETLLGLTNKKIILAK